MNFTAFQSAANLQSSLNPANGLGTASLAVIYSTFIISALFLPSYIIKFIGCRWTMVVSLCGYVTYPLANFYPHWGTLIPSSVLVGLSAAPLWSAKCTYLTTSASRYAKLTDDTTDAVIHKFFGVFFLFFQTSQIIGNLISSFVLSSNAISNLEFPTCYNKSYIEHNCGKHDCQSNLTAARLLYNSSECPVTNLNSSGPSDSTIYTLMGIYTALSLSGAFIMALGVDNIEVQCAETRGPFSLLIATFKQMKDKRQLLLIPITMFSGFEQAFLTGDITRSFITCPLGVNWVGFVLICYAACDAISSLLFGGAEKYVGRMPIFTCGAIINIALIITLLVWLPYPDDVALFFILPALWGIADAVWQTQITAFYGVIFVNNQEACFANYNVWKSLGFVIAFAYQNFICVSSKLWVLLAVLLLGMVSYYYVEFEERTKNSTEVKSNAKSPEENKAYVE
uniref:Protein unc-93 homolog A n=1 Tax=Phallusia mammillata TaxID=59560 RepID=A0A6F9DWW3_9ASCI|nr:protein unc-93 homolog A-like [Phallusia mammillata]